MTKKSGRSSSALRAIVGVPTSFLSGLAIGIVAPVAAVAGMALIIKQITGKLPFLSHTWPEEGDERHLSIRLMPPDEARDAFEREKSRISGELNRLSTEIQNLTEQARAKAQASMPRQE